ncbi:MAG: penicillin-binding protein 1C [Verrucomicrobia bacterium]|nr:penicillin-binding protein 1C [Verrucomicrobiota bacterium]
MNAAFISRWMRRGWRRILWIGATAMVAAIATFAALWLIFPFHKESLYNIPASVSWCDRDGVPLRIRLSAGDFDSVPTYVYHGDDWIAKAVVAAEDQRFWRHCGVDICAVARSCKQAATSMRRVSGASTLSMQLVRRSCPRQRNLIAKGIEAFRALQMERQLTKREIISLYLNHAPLGANLVGIEAASRRYFAKGAHDLSLGEASLLAGIPQSPTRFNPVKYPAAAKTRQAYVLRRMVACSFITREQMDNALAQPLRFRDNRYPFLAPHFCDMLARQAANGAIEMRTTLDLGLQQTIEESLAKYAPTLRAERIRGAAALVLDAKTSEVLALVGSPDFRARTKGAQVNAAVAPRSAGSTLKPFAYAVATDRGMLTPLRVLYDIPQSYSDYDPANFDKTHGGVVTVRDALIRSLNLPAIDVEKRIGQPLFHAKLRELGLQTLTEPAAHYGLGLVLGNAEVTLLDLTNAYACLARGGVYLPYRTMPSAASTAAAGTRQFSAEASWLISDILGGDERAMDSSGTVADIRIPRLAWKTGTSSGFRDAWTIAYNPDFVIGVWLGNPDGRPSGFLVGRKAATPIVWDICRRLYPTGNGPWFAKPEAIEDREVCALSGQTPSPNCPRKIHDHAIKDVSRYETCEVHLLGTAAVWPVAVEAFLKTQPSAGGDDDKCELVITTPANGSSYLFMPDMAQPQQQRIPFTANFSNASADLHWFVNDQYLGASKSGETLFWSLSKGQHRIVCADPKGKSRGVVISVR